MKLLVPKLVVVFSLGVVLRTVLIIVLKNIPEEYLFDAGLACVLTAFLTAVMVFVVIYPEN